MIGIIDYGLGNLASVAGAIDYLGHRSFISADADELEKADKLILPGVGAFGDGMRLLRERGLIDAIDTMVNRHKTPILGICLGSQLMTESSDEFGYHDGLGWVPARVVGFDAAAENLRVPHVGWNDTYLRAPTVLFEGVEDGALFYYVHSFRITTSDPDIVVAECEYGDRFVSAYAMGHIYGTQFHPEKSQQAGLMLLSNFIDKAA